MLYSQLQLVLLSLTATVCSYESRTLPLFPGHRYLGPGNRLHNGEPVDEDDRIARRHDEAYSRAQSDADVFAADRQYTKEFFKDFVSTGNWHSALGAVGLGTKNLVEEKVLGRSLYGIPPGRKRGNQEQPGPSSAKRQQHDTTDGDEKMSETAAEAPSALRQEEQVLEVTIRIHPNTFNKFYEYLATTEWSQCSMTARFLPPGATPC